MTRNSCVSAFICGSHICKVQPSEFDSISVGPPSRPSTETLSRQPSASIMGMVIEPLLVMRGFDPRIHLETNIPIKWMDCRVKPRQRHPGLCFVQGIEQPVDQGL